MYLQNTVISGDIQGNVKLCKMHSFIFFNEKTMHFIRTAFLGFIRTKGMGEIFHVTNKRGKCLYVINFTSVIYHEVTENDNKFVPYFTILSKSSHDCLDNRIK